TEVDDLITLDQNFIPQNFSEAVIEGLEAEISANIAEWIARAALSYVDPRDDQTDNRLPRRARRSAKLEAERRFGKTRAALSLIAQSRRFDDPDNTIEVNGYGIVNVAVSRELSKNWTLRGRFNNLFDKEYQTVNSFDELDRNVFVTLAYQPHE
ncbi:MAG: TonB-dependent receptor, partial [Gammaproteobacteria bacterium]|nr:TonB-dependent receptor [Gammaproteobacteria bacterium]